MNPFSPDTPILDPPAPAELWVAIVNYRTPALAADCLRSLAAERQRLAASPQAATDLWAVIVDNGSGDGSAGLLAREIARQEWTDWALLHPAKRNGGFAAGNNAALRALLDARRHAPDAVLFLNPDTLVTPGAVEGMLAFLRDRPHVGVVGAQLQDPGGQPQRSAHRLPSPLGELLSAARVGFLDRLLGRFAVSLPLSTVPQPCQWVSGAALMVRWDALQQVGPMDEDFFLYFEEVDLCARILRARWECWQLPRSVILHREGSATGLPAPRKRRPRYWYHSRRRFFLKHGGLGTLLQADALWALGRLIFLARRLLPGTRQPTPDPRCFAWDLLAGDLLALCSRPTLRQLRHPPNSAQTAAAGAPACTRPHSSAA